MDNPDVHTFMKQQMFHVASVSDLTSSFSSSSSPVVARFSSDSCGVNKLRFMIDSESNKDINVHLQHSQLLKLSPLQSVCTSEATETDKEEIYSRGVIIQFIKEEESRDFHCAFEQWKNEACSQESQLPNGMVSDAASKFDSKIEASSAKMYFHYYGQLLHQQNMLQDYVRTGTYYAAVIENRVDYSGRIVVDVGAGSGILSLFAAQAGAKHVYAVEASEMAEYARKLIDGNPELAQRITVIKGKVEEVVLPEQADILISEPMGTMLVNERMLESYVIARDRFLVSNGKMFPTLGRIHMAPFSDEYLYMEIANKALFWQQPDYFGVNLTSLHGTAFQGCFTQPVVDAFDPRLLVSPAMSHVINFTSIKEEELYEIDIPLKFIASVGTIIHGLACWFDVLFDGSTVQRWLSTAPGAPTTHWYQLRCVLSQPIYVVSGQEITGRLHMIAHKAQSYTLNLTLSAKTWGPGAELGGVLQTSSGKFDLKEPYHRMSGEQIFPVAQDQLSQLLQQVEAGSDFLQSPIQVYEANLPSIFSQNEAKFQSNEAKLQSLQSIFSQNETKLQSLFSQKAKLQSNEAKLQSSEAKLKSNEAKLQSIFSQNEAKLKSSEAKLQSIEAKLQSIEAKLQSIEAKLHSLFSQKMRE